MALVFFKFIIYTDNMKKLLFILTLCMLATAFVQAATVYADDYLFQNQIYINDQYSCQAVRIHPNWLLTSAHCVKQYLGKPSCSIRIMVAEGKNASASVLKEDCDEVYIHTEQTEDQKKQLVWDIALIRFMMPQSEDEYEFLDKDGNMILKEEFKKELAMDSSLRIAWKGRHLRVFPSLYMYKNKHGKFLRNKLLVPRWTNGVFTYLNSTERVAYLGEKENLWVTPGFGVEEGNSGGAVLAVRKHKQPVLIGIVTAKEDNRDMFSEENKQWVPDLAKAKELFIFTGFGQDTTAKFILNTLAGFGDYLQTSKISNVQDSQNPLQETEYIVAK